MNNDKLNSSSPFPAAAFFLVLLAALWLLWPGTGGGFLFDDYPNLQPLKELGGIHDLDDLRTFVFGGGAGPTGRPLAMLSFLIEDNAWGGNPTSYKYTNLLLHLLNGCLLAWAGLLLGRLYGLSEDRAQQLAVFNAAIWLLHPLFISTVFYIVQRMAILATLFCLAAITGYLHGRLLLQKRPRSAYLWMGLSIALGTLLGVLSKENAALLPLLILVIEFCAPQHEPRPARAFRAIFLWLPSFAVGLYLLSRVNLDPGIWPTRSFDQVERLLTEPRILWEYLANLLVPHIEEAGLYRDNIRISTGWLQPVTTLWAVLGLLAVTIGAFLARKRYPLLSLGILFYLTGHLVESSVIGLEIYFEHRNYLPAAFLFLPVGHAILGLERWTSRPVVALTSMSLIALMGLMAHQRAQLWGDSIQLKAYWALANPDSPRAQNSLAAVYYNLGRTEEALRTLDRAIERSPDSALLNISRLQHLVYNGKATSTEFTQTADRLRRQSFNIEALSLTRELVTAIIDHNKPGWEREGARRLLQAFKTNAAYAQQIPVKQLVPYLEGRLDLAGNAPDAALHNYSTTLKYNHQFKVIMLMVAELAGAGYPQQALTLLRKAASSGALDTNEHLFTLQPTYRNEIKRIRQLLLRDLKNNNTQGSAEQPPTIPEGERGAH